MSGGVNARPSGRSRTLTAIVVRAGALAASGFVLTNVFSVAFYVVLAHLATPHDFGLLAAGGVLVYFSMTVIDSGLAAALIRRDDRVEEAANTVLIATAASGAVLTLLALAAAPVVGRFFGSAHVTAVAVAMSGILFVRSLGVVPNALLQKRFSFARRAVAGPAGVVAFGAVSVAATARGWGVWGLVLGSYASAVTDVALGWLFARWRPRPGLASVAMWRSLAGFGRHVVVADVVMGAGDKIDALFVGRLLGTAALGQYRYAWRVAVLPLAAIVNVGGYVLYPAFASIAAEPDRMRVAFMRAFRWLSVAALPASLVLLPLGEPLVVLAFGEPWRPAGRAVAAMCCFAAGQALGSLVGQAWLAVGRPQLLPRLHLLSVVALALLMLALLPLGLVGMGLALSFSSLCVGVYAIRGAAAALQIPVRVLVRELAPPAVAAATMALALVALDRGAVHAADHGAVAGLALLALETLAGAALYLLLLAAFSPARAHDLQTLANRALGRQPGLAVTSPAPAAKPYRRPRNLIP